MLRLLRPVGTRLLIPQQSEAPQLRYTPPAETEIGSRSGQRSRSTSPREGVSPLPILQAHFLNGTLARCRPARPE